MKGGTPCDGTVAPAIRTTTARPTPSAIGLRRPIRSSNALGLALGKQLQAHHERDRADNRDGVERRLARGDEGRHVVAEQGQVLRAEEDPAEDDQVEGDEPAKPAGQQAEPPVQPVLGREPGALVGAPGDEVPRRPVPEPAEGHRDHQVHVGADPALAVAAQRDVQVVAQEARQGHVPAPPEVAEARRAVRAVEVLREDEAQHQRQPYRHVRVAREVAVDLGGVAVGGEQGVGGRERLWHREHRVDELARQVVGDHQLLDEPQRDQRQPRPHGDAVRVSRRLQLRQELARAHDRPGDEVREEAEVNRRVHQRGGLGLAPVGVDHVGDGLEAEEADPDGQRDRQEWQRHPEARRVEHVADVRDEEAVVLEHGEDPEVERDPSRHDQLPRALVIGAVDEVDRELADDRDRRQQQAEARVGGRVEDVARREDEHLPQRLTRHQRPRDREHDREEDREFDGREEQRTRDAREWARCAGRAPNARWGWARWRS